jgi:hypothetical protein
MTLSAMWESGMTTLPIVTGKAIASIMKTAFKAVIFGCRFGFSAVTAAPYSGGRGGGAGFVSAAAAISGTVSVSVFAAASSHVSGKSGAPSSTFAFSADLTCITESVSRRFLPVKKKQDKEQQSRGLADGNAENGEADCF